MPSTASTPPPPNLRCRLPRILATPSNVPPPPGPSSSATPQATASDTRSRDPLIVTTTIPPDEAPAVTRCGLLAPAARSATAPRPRRRMREMQIDRVAFDVPATLSDQDFYWVRDMVLSSWQDFLSCTDNAARERLKEVLCHNWEWRDQGLVEDGGTGDGGLLWRV